MNLFKFPPISLSITIGLDYRSMMCQDPVSVYVVYLNHTLTLIYSEWDLEGERIHCVVNYTKNEVIGSFIQPVTSTMARGVS